MDEEAILLEALQITSPEERATFLEQACGGNKELRESVEQLLDAHERAGRFLFDAPTSLPLARMGRARVEPVPLDLRSDEGPGTRIGPYELLQQLGEGGMGTVFLAEQDQPVKRRVALKIIKVGMDTRQVIARFEQERQALALMDHPHIAKVLDAGTTSAGRPFFVMELVLGVPITQYCDQAQLTLRERLELFIPVCQAVQHAHQKGIIHRDLKSSNVMVGLYDGHPISKVIDFGIAKATGQQLTERTMFTEVGQIVGTLEYMAPEQTEPNCLDIDTRADIYSLGVLLYELLTGSTPFSSEELRRWAFDEMLRIIREVEPLKPSTRLSNAQELALIAAQRKLEPRRLTKIVSGDLDWIVMKCLEKERGRRYESANGLAADLARFLRDEPVAAGPPSATYRLRKFAHRHKLAITTTAIVALCLLAGLVGTSWQAIRARRAEHQAAEEAAVARAVNEFLQDDLLGMAGASDQLRARIEPDPGLKLTTLLDRALAEVDNRFSDQPRVRSEVQNTLGHALMSIGRYRDAARLLEQVRKYLEKTAGPEARETLAASNDLEITYANLGQLDEAVALGEQTLELSRKIHGLNGAASLAAMGTLAEVYHMAGQLQKALALHEQALELARRIYGPEHPETLTSINNVAIALEEVGRHGEARELLEPALRSRRRILGQEHPNTLLAMNNLAGIYRDSGQLDKALALHGEAIPLMRKVLGPEHPDTILALGSQANTYAATGENDKAIELQEQVLAMRQRILGPDHPQTLLAMDNLAHAYGSAGHFDKALPLHEQAVELSRKILGPDHPDTLRGMMNLGYVCWYMHQLPRAIEILEEVRRLQVSSLPAEHPEIFWNEAHLGRAYRDAGRVAEALPLLEEAYRKGGDQPGLDWVGDELLKTYARAGKTAEATALANKLLSGVREELPSGSPQLASALVRTALPLLELQAWDAAEPMLRDALAFREQHTPQDWRTFNTRSMLGEVLLGQRRFADAEPLLVQGYEGIKQCEEQLPADVRIRVAEALERLVTLYEVWNKPDEAARWRTEQEARKAAAETAK